MTTIVFPTLTRSAPQSVEIGLKSNSQVFVSPLSGDTQTLELPGARWTLSFLFNSLERADAGEMEAFLAKLRGQANRAQVMVWGRRTPRGTWAGSPAVNNESASPTELQTGNQLICNGFTASATVKRGDYFNVGTAGELKRVTEDGTADGSGNLTITFEPPLRASPAHGTSLISSDCVVPLMIANDPHLKQNLMQADLSDFQLDLTEVFA